ncbi:MAG: twin-arginine translocase TatA/TatE family subunit [Alphaproteobacteria bacterium]|nr:twin-arginine translocase TatA/TatE family subunit [Alphaproteobacteria bacterium]
MSLGIPEIIVILVVVLVLFGGKKIPELARGLGKAQAEYKKAKEAFENEVNELDTPTNTSSKKPLKKKATAKKTTKKGMVKQTAKTAKK